MSDYLKRVPIWLSKKQGKKYPVKFSLMEFSDVDKSDNFVLLSTVHAVKGFEFKNVLMDKTFPSSKALNIVANAVNYSLQINFQRKDA